MNAQRLPAESPVANVDSATGAVDAQNPWVGLASFTEETRAFFYGREEEVAELARRVQRKLLTVLFGQSGLGKTSILRAGLVPRLRGHGYCPVYVRIDYGRDAPEPAEQIKQAIARTASESGEWTQAGVAIEGESLWEFLHHRDDVLRDARGATLVPLLIFDQFEEIFTLAQTDDFGRARAARFIEELSDLVENRAPKAFEARLDADESAAEQFDFARSDYRVLISLREDYLAPLEGLKTRMPSVAQNRLRLAPMTGAQAMQAVLLPGKTLVSEEVAAAIVRFVSGGAEVANAEVEPSLLSLICRELNDTRIAQGRSEISLDLLAGSHESILTNFYERALADQPAEVRRIVEDDLLTESGFRENVAEESLLRRFDAAHAAPDTLRKLVNRRLLRIEERLDKRRVELTHDVLCSVVRGSRDRRHEREAREVAERQLAEQQSREAAARRALVRARQVATVCIVLAAGAIIAAGFAYFNSQRAKRAEHEAQETRASSEQARNQAERLIGYLSEDLARELESVGRLETLAEFSQRQIDYFHALPPGLRGPESIRNASLAMINQAKTLRRLGKLDSADADAQEAIALLTPLRAQGDSSERIAAALASAYGIQSAILDNRNDARAPEVLQKAVSILAPLAERPAPSIEVKRAYVEVLQRVGYQDQSSTRNEEAVTALTKAMKIADDLGAHTFADLDMSTMYAECAAWLVSAYSNLGRTDDARRVGEEARAVAMKVLQLRPGYRIALHSAQVIDGSLAQIAQQELNPEDALRHGRDDIEVSTQALALDPGNTVAANNLAVAFGEVGDSLWDAGRLRESMGLYQKAMDTQKIAAASGGATFTLTALYTGISFEYRQAQIGDDQGAAKTWKGLEPLIDQLHQTQAPDGFVAQLGDLLGDAARIITQYYDGKYSDALQIGTADAAKLRALPARGSFQVRQRNYVQAVLAEASGRAAFANGDFPAAERLTQTALEARRGLGDDSANDQREIDNLSTFQAMAMARAGKNAEARRIIEPIVLRQRQTVARNRGNQWVSMDLAAGLYVQSLADPARHEALLAEAVDLVDKLAPEVRNAREPRRWREWMRTAK